MSEVVPLAQRLERRVARFENRRADWTVFGFETTKNPKFARIRRRHLGASGSVDHNDPQLLVLQAKAGAPAPATAAE